MLYSQPLLYWTSQVGTPDTMAREKWKKITSEYDATLVSQFYKGLKFIAKCVKNRSAIVVAIMTAETLLQDLVDDESNYIYNFKPLFEAFERHWLRLERGTMVPILDISETKKSSIYCYLLKLSRYHVAVNHI